MAYDTTALGFEPDSVGLPWFRRALAHGLAVMAPSVVFLGIPIWQVRSDPSRGPLVVAVALTMAAFYLGAALAVTLPHRIRVAWVAGMASVLIALGVVTGEPASIAYSNAYVCAVAAILLPWEEARVAITGVGLVGISVALLVSDPLGVALAAFGVAMSFTLAMNMRRCQAQRALELELARSTALAVVAERERISRDLHDILGHSLTTIAVKADLAGRLIDRSAPDAKVQVAEIAAITRQALADVRATVAGMREVRLATEVASARSVLAASGVTPHVPSALPALSDEASELWGYVVREAVTNVVRHAHAASCTIVIESDGVRVSDDGTGIDRVSSLTVGGHGLAGLTERVQRAGGTVEVQSGPSGTTVHARFPAEVAA